MTNSDRPPRGFLLGKFMPPHCGHVFLAQFARAYVGELTILCCSLHDDPIPGHLRFEWMKELFPTCRVVWCVEPLPQAPEDDPVHFWQLWRDVVRRFHPEPIDAVFASEQYGHRLAAEVGARFVPCDPLRSAFPISATEIRKNPFACWKWVPEPVRPYFALRICMFGPESSGKTTLGSALARHFDTAFVPEYGRTYTDTFGTMLDANDLRLIALGQRASTEAALRRANRVLIEDTDAAMTAVWSGLLGLDGFDPNEFESRADHYLLCDVDFPWVDDGTRYFRDIDTRRDFFKRCEQELRRRSLPYTIVSGSHEDRLAAAVAIVERLLMDGPPRRP